MWYEEEGQGLMGVRKNAFWLDWPGAPSCINMKLAGPEERHKTQAAAQGPARGPSHSSDAFSNPKCIHLIQMATWLSYRLTQHQTIS